VLLKSEHREKFEELLEESFGHLTIKNTEPLEGGRLRYELAMTPKYRQHLERMTLDQAVKTIRNRIDQFGVAEPDIRKQPQDNRIQVQLPGLEDPQRAIEVIGKTAHLEFKIVEEDVDLEKAQKGILPPGVELRTLREETPGGAVRETPIAVRKEAAMTGETIVDAHTSFDNFGQPYVSLTFNSRGARQFARVTGENTGRRMAIVLDGTVYSAPVIQEKITGGRASISGRFTTDEAHDLSIVLRAGSLPAPVNILEERSVGPSLGQESINRGVKSALLGGLVVLAFMVVYYGFGGLVADLVLVLNILLIMAGLAAFGATLTLPGIAGIILTIGMAVDANVLIFERIREELDKGLNPTAAVDEGYGRATLTILDANVTTIIAAIILYQFGTGPVRGFAVTLTLGILASMFTAIFVSRIMFDLWLTKVKRTALSI
jgi:preprotein translocase subunit SecD